MTIKKTIAPPSEEEDGRGDQKGQESLTLVPVKARGHKHIKLGGEYWEGKRDGPKKGHAHIGDKLSLQGCVDQLYVGVSPPTANL